MSPSAPDGPAAESGCVLARIVQYQCKKGDYITCRPLERLFKRCPGRPSVELIQEDGIFVDVRTHRDAASDLGDVVRAHRTAPPH
ncbi:hypothetical protein H4R19_006895 [Coemansia spiralis]|nr:hypothetical protein H4R19_006895 [Coemansia spiralis]